MFEDLIEAIESGNLDAVKLVLEQAKTEGKLKELLSARGNNYHGTVLQCAVRAENLEIVKCLVNGGADLDAKNKYGSTALQAAARAGHLGIVQYLVARDTAINAEGRLASAVNAAASGGHLGIVQYLVEEKNADINAKDDVGVTALEGAASSGNIELVKYLVDQGANINVQKDENHNDSKYSRESYIRSRSILRDVSLVVAYIRSNTRLLESVGSCQQTIRMIQDKIRAWDLYIQRLNINVKGKQLIVALYRAGREGRLGKPEYERLYERGLYERDGLFSSTALQEAASGGCLDVVQYLVERGADINAKDDYGITALYCASEAGHLGIVEYLVGKGAHINAKDIQGTTALQAAANAGHVEIVRYLVERGANINAKNKYLGTALQILESSGPEHEEYREIVDFLKEAHAKDSRKKGMMYAGACVGAAAGGVALLCGVTLALGVGAATPCVAAILILCAAAAIGAGVGALVGTFVEKVLESQRLGQSVNTTTP